MPSWLNQHRKSELVDLATLAGIEDIAELRKDQIVALLEEQLTTNASKLSKLPSFNEYYSRRGSPVKRESGSTPALLSDGDITRSVVRSRAQRVSRVKGEADTHLPSSPTAANTTAAVRRAAATALASPAAAVTSPAPAAVTSPAPAPALASTTPARPAIEESEFLSPARAPFPPSPAVVADVIEDQTAIISAGIDRLWTSTHIMDYVYQARIELSSVTGVQITILALEFFWLHRAIVDWTFAFDVPSFMGLRGFALFLPNLFTLLTKNYWAPSLLWAAMNFWIPLATGWFWNLSLKLKKKDGLESWKPKYRVDPLTFSIAKALVSWLVYSQNKRLMGVFADETVAVVENAMPAGYSGVMVAAYIGMATSIWDGIQGKKSSQ